MPFPTVHSPIFAATDRVLFGPEPTTAGERTRLQAAGVTHVLDLRAEVPASVSDAYWAGTGVVHHRDPLIDDGRRQPASVYVDGVTFVANALSNPANRVYIHCAAGQYRAPSMVYAVLRAAGYTPDQAWATVQRARSNTYPQYVPSAEAAVPQLPRISPQWLGGDPVAGVPSVTVRAPSGGTSVWVALAFTVAAGAGAMWLANRQPARRRRLA